MEITIFFFLFHKIIGQNFAKRRLNISIIGLAQDIDFASIVLLYRYP